MSLKEKHDKTYVFAQMPVGKAVAYLVIPTVLTQIITILYNLADTFFIGQLNQPDLVAAVGVCLPPMMLLTALANLFGVGASSAISRALGSGDEGRARLCSSFSLWCGLLVTAVYILATVVFRDGFIDLIGGSGSPHGYVASYLFWTMSLGGLIFFAASLLAHFLKTLGKSVQASIGTASGAVLNIILDPIFLFGLNMGIEGVAIASLLGQVLSLVLLAWFLVRCKGEGIIQPVLTTEAFTGGVGREIVQIGLVSFCMTALAQVSNTCVNMLVSPYGSAYLAASSVAIKLNIASFSIASGLSVGVLPLLGFNYAAGNGERVKQALKVQFTFIICTTVICSLLCLIFPRQIIAFFINDPVTIESGVSYITAVALTMVPSALVFGCTSYLQSIGQKRRPYILTFTRMGTVDVIFMCLFSVIFGAPGILFGKPAADWLCLCTACFVINNLRKHVNPFASSAVHEKSANE